MTSKCHVFSSTVPEKLKGGPNWLARGEPLGFLTSILLQNINRIEAGPFGDIWKFSGKKSHSAEKNRRDLLVSSGFVNNL